jgi:hypothetical protein
VCLLCWQCYSLLKSARTYFLSFFQLFFSFTWHQHQLPHCCYLVALFSLQKSYHNTYQKSDFIMTSVSFIHIFCVWYWHWLQSHSCSDAHDCEKHVASLMCLSLQWNVFVLLSLHHCLCCLKKSTLHILLLILSLSVTVTSLTLILWFLIALIHFCCLQCSKVIAALLNHKCEVVKNVQCSQCFKNCKACDSICKMLTKHCVWLMILLDSDWVQCSSQQVIHCCHHHTWEKEHKQRADSAAASYIKAVEAHLHVADRHDLRKKPTSMIKIKLLQLEKSCHQTCLFEDMLDSYVLWYTVTFHSLYMLLLTFFRTIFLL